MKVDESGLVQSVRMRLLAAATVAASDPNTVLVRYGIERFLPSRTQLGKPLASSGPF